MTTLHGMCRRSTAFEPGLALVLMLVADRATVATFTECIQRQRKDISTWPLAIFYVLSSRALSVLESACVRDRGQRGGMSQLRRRKGYDQQLPDASV